MELDFYYCFKDNFKETADLSNWRFFLYFWIPHERIRAVAEGIKTYILIIF